MTPTLDMNVVPIIMKYLRPKDLYACTLASRQLCKIAIPVLWESPFGKSFSRNIDVFLCYLGFLKDQELQDILRKFNIPELKAKHMFTSNRPLFDYPSFIRELHFNAFFLVGSFLEDRGYRCDSDIDIYPNELIHLVLKIFKRRRVRFNSFLISENSQKFYSEDFQILEDYRYAKLFASVKSVVIERVFYPNPLIEVKRVFSNLEHIEIWFRPLYTIDLIDSGVEQICNFIESQKQLISFRIFGLVDWTWEIFEAISKHSNSLRYLEFDLVNFRDCTPEDWRVIVKCQKLRKLVITDYENIDEDCARELHSGEFLSLEKINITNKLFNRCRTLEDWVESRKRNVMEEKRWGKYKRDEYKRGGNGNNNGNGNIGSQNGNNNGNNNLGGGFNGNSNGNNNLGSYNGNSNGNNNRPSYWYKRDEEEKRWGKYKRGLYKRDEEEKRWGKYKRDEYKRGGNGNNNGNGNIGSQNGNNNGNNNLGGGFNGNSNGNNNLGSSNGNSNGNNNRPSYWYKRDLYKRDGSGNGNGNGNVGSNNGNANGNNNVGANNGNGNGNNNLGSNNGNKNGNNNLGANNGNANGNNNLGSNNGNLNGNNNLGSNNGNKNGNNNLGSNNGNLNGNNNLGSNNGNKNGNNNLGSNNGNKNGNNNLGSNNGNLNGNNNLGNNNGGNNGNNNVGSNNGGNNGNNNVGSNNGGGNGNNNR
ncbi:hypothetical protein G9A89_006378 [Geosiphon pyriformis]|nr:hypothetical protein G9A89_006378 [Geosiphon pyriformis]